MQVTEGEQHWQTTRSRELATQLEVPREAGTELPAMEVARGHGGLTGPKLVGPQNLLGARQRAAEGERVLFPLNAMSAEGRERPAR